MMSSKKEYEAKIKQLSKQNPDEAFFLKKNQNAIIDLHIFSSQTADALNNFYSQHDTPLDTACIAVIMADNYAKLLITAEQEHGPALAKEIKKRFNERVKHTLGTDED